MSNSFPIKHLLDSNPSTSGQQYTDPLTNRIREVTAAGIITTVAGTGQRGVVGDSGLATAAVLFGPFDVAVDSNGNLLVADWAQFRVRKVTTATGIIATVAGNGDSGFSGDNGPAVEATFSGPVGVAVDAAGNLYIADSNPFDPDSGNNRIRKVAVDTENIITIAGNGETGFSGDTGLATAARLEAPLGIAVDALGNVYFADTENNRIRKVTAETGIISTVAGNGRDDFEGDGGPATATALSTPSGVAVDGFGNLFIADSGNNRIRKVNAETGIITTLAGDGLPGFSGDGGQATAAQLSFPVDVTVDDSGNLFIADTVNNLIRMVAAGTGIITTVAGNGNFGGSGDGGPATAAELGGTFGVAVDAAGNLFIADFGNDRIRAVRGPIG